MLINKIIKNIFFFVFLIICSKANAHIHIGRDGETLEQLSNYYYGTAQKAIIIRAANGFMHPDNGSVLQGERVNIPTLTFHRVEKGEDWYELANKYLGTSRRAEFLAQLNELLPQHPPPPGKIIKIPYQLLYVFAPDETLKSVTRLFLSEKISPDWLANYNLKRKRKYSRGDAILIPLIDIDFTEKAKQAIESQRKSQAGEQDKLAQIQAVESIALLRESFEKGDYLEIIAMGNQLLSITGLSNPQRVGVYQFMAFAYVAFEDNLQAKNYFFKALQLQPSMELSPITVSPKILKFFEQAREEMLNQELIID